MFKTYVNQKHQLDHNNTLSSFCLQSKNPESELHHQDHKTTWQYEKSGPGDHDKDSYESKDTLWSPLMNKLFLTCLFACLLGVSFVMFWFCVVQFSRLVQTIKLFFFLMRSLYLNLHLVSVYKYLKK